MSNRRRISLKQNKTKKNIKPQRGGEGEVTDEAMAAALEKRRTDKLAERQKAIADMKESRAAAAAKATAERNQRTAAADARLAANNKQKKAELEAKKIADSQIKQKQLEVDGKTKALEDAQDNLSLFKDKNNSNGYTHGGLRKSAELLAVEKAQADLKTAKSELDVAKKNNSVQTRFENAVNERMKAGKIAAIEERFRTSKISKNLETADAEVNAANEALNKTPGDNKLTQNVNDAIAKQKRFQQLKTIEDKAKAKEIKAVNNPESDDDGAPASFKSRMGAAGASFSNKAKSLVGYKPNPEQTSMIASLAKTVAKMGAKEATNYTNNFVKKYPELGQFVNDNDIVNRATNAKNTTMKFARNFKAHASTAKDMARAKLKQLAHREDGKPIPSFFENMKRAASIGTQFSSNITGNLLGEVGEYLGVDPDVKLEAAVGDSLTRAGEIARGTMTAINSDQGKVDVKNIKDSVDEVNTKLIQPIVGKTVDAIAEDGEKLGAALGKSVSSFISATPLGIPLNALKTVGDSAEAVGKMISITSKLAGAADETKTALEDGQSSVIGDIKDSVNSLMDQALDEIDNNPKVKESGKEEDSGENQQQKEDDISSGQQGGGRNMHKLMQMHKGGSMVARRVAKTRKEFFGPLRHHKTRKQH